MFSLSVLLISSSKGFLHFRSLPCPFVGDLHYCTFILSVCKMRLPLRVGNSLFRTFFLLLLLHFKKSDERECHLQVKSDGSNSFFTKEWIALLMSDLLQFFLFTMLFPFYAPSKEWIAVKDYICSRHSLKKSDGCDLLSLLLTKIQWFRTKNQRVNPNPAASA